MGLYEIVVDAAIAFSKSFDNVAVAKGQAFATWALTSILPWAGTLLFFKTMVKSLLEGDGLVDFVADMIETFFMVAGIWFILANWGDVATVLLAFKSEFTSVVTGGSGNMVEYTGEQVSAPIGGLIDHLIGEVDETLTSVQKDVAKASRAPVGGTPSPAPVPSGP